MPRATSGRHGDIGIFLRDSIKQHLNVLHIITLYNRIKYDPQISTIPRARLKIVFFPDFTVTNGQLIYPTAGLSEQISVIGKEASGTGNMQGVGLQHGNSERQENLKDQISTDDLNK